MLIKNLKDLIKDCGERFVPLCHIMISIFRIKEGHLAETFAIVALCIWNNQKAKHHDKVMTTCKIYSRAVELMQEYRSVIQDIHVLAKKVNIAIANKTFKSCIK